MSSSIPVTFLTGGTGFLGSHIGAALLRKGEKTYFLTRGSRKIPASGRLQNILDWHNIDPSLRSNARIIEGSLEKPIQDIDRIIHCASDTSFSERNRNRVWASNVDFLETLLDFAARCGISSLIHVSTAYVAGRSSGPCPEEPIENVRFFNVYEESKAEAERFLLERCSMQGIRLTIVRPSIVYGDSRTGRTFRFNALYYPVKTTLFLKKIFLQDIRERGGEKAAEAGVTVDPDGTIHLPLRLEVHSKGGVNLIPVDFFIDAFFAILEDSPNGGIYHIVSPRLTKIEDIIRYVQNQFNLKGIQACTKEEFEKRSLNSLEKLYERYLEAYFPYIKDTREFLKEKTDSLLKRRGIVCPEFDEEMFRRCMSYAVENEWQSL